MQSFGKEASVKCQWPCHITPPPSVAFQMVHSNEISQAGNTGKKEDFEKLKQRLKNNKTGTENLKRIMSVSALGEHLYRYILRAFYCHLIIKTRNCKWPVNTD